MPRFLPLLVLLLASALHAALPTRPGREIPLTPPETGVASSTQSGAFVASDGESFLVVWTDDRASGSDVYAARIAADGRILDPLGIVVMRNAYSVGAVWNGERYLVGAVTAYETWVISVANGVAGEPRKIFSGNTPPGAMAMATNGETTLIASSGGNGALLDRSGAPVATLSLQSRTGPIAVASSRSAYLVAVREGDSVVMQDVAFDGTVRPAAEFPWSPGSSGIAVASDGDRFLVAWTAERLHWQLFRSAGSPIADVQTNAGDEPRPGRRYHWPRAIWRGGEFLITYGGLEANGSLSMRAVRTAGGPSTGSPMTFASTPSGAPIDMAIDRDGRGVAVWPRIGGSLRVSRFDPSTIASGIPFADERPVAFSAREQSAPALLNAGGVLLAWWTEVEEGKVVVRAGRVGAPPATIPIARWDRLKMVSDGREVWLVWWDSGVFARRYDLDFNALGETLRIGDETSQATFDAAAGDGVLVAVWQTRDQDVDGARVEGTSVTPLAFTRAAFEDENPGIVWNGREFVAAWIHKKSADWWQFPSAPGQVMARRIARDGSFVDAQPVLVHDSGHHLALTHVAPAIDGAAILWRSNRGDQPILGAVFAGTLLPPVREVATRRFADEMVPFGDGYVVMTDTFELLELGPALDVRQRASVDFGAVRFVTLTALADRLVFGYQRLDEEHGRVYRAFVAGLAARRRAGPRPG